MFAIEEIQNIHDRLTKGLPEYATKLGEIGVQRYVSYIADGHSEYFGASENHATSAPAHESFPIAPKSNRDAFLKAMNDHEQRKTDYFTFSKELAAAGIERWEVDVRKRSISFLDVAGTVLLAEPIPDHNPSKPSGIRSETEIKK